MMAFSVCSVRCSPSSPPPLRCLHNAHLSSTSMAVSIKTKLSSSKTLSGSPLILKNSTTLSTVVYPLQKPPFPMVFAAKGYKMKTHKASAKRFRVTGSGKIVRRRAGKQHLLGKKNTKRKLRLSKIHAVHRSDYNNVIGALPYLKVNRKAT